MMVLALLQPFRSLQKPQTEVSPGLSTLLNLQIQQPMVSLTYSLSAIVFALLLCSLQLPQMAVMLLKQPMAV